MKASDFSNVGKYFSPSKATPRSYRETCEHMFICRDIFKILYICVCIYEREAEGRLWMRAGAATRQLPGQSCHATSVPATF